jgi:RNA polymerase sigma factor (sigma-70 family)
VATHKDTRDSRRPASLPAGVFEQYRPELRRFLRSRARQAQTVDDLAQEVYLRMLRFPAAQVVRQPQAYLYRIASNVVHDFNLRLQHEQVTYDSEALETATESPSHLSRDDFTHQLGAEQELERVLARLPRAWQAALVLRKRDGLSYVEIAKALGVSVHAVKKYIARAVAYCRSANWER